MLGTNLRDALRVVRRHPGFAAAVVLTLSLGIGAVTAIFSALDGLLLRPVPFHDPDRLVQVQVTRGDLASPLVDPEAAAVWREQDVFEAVRAHSGRTVTLSGRGEPQSLRAGLFEPGLLDLLGVSPMLGRTFLPEESLPGSRRVVLLGEELWKGGFGGDPEVVGSTVTLDGESHTVIGILPPTVRVLPDGMVQLALPLPELGPDGSSAAPVYLLGRVRGDVPMPTAEARLGEVTQVLDTERPREQGWGVELEPLRNWVGDHLEAALAVLGGAVAFLLLIACANAAGLLFVHGTAREHEFAIRAAVGGSRAVLIRQLVTESAVLAALAGAFGIGLAYAAVRLMLGIIPPGLLGFSYTPVEVNGRVLLFALAATSATSVLFSLLPAFRVSRASPAPRGTGRGITASRGQRRVRSSLIVTEMALAVVLLTGAALLGRSFFRLFVVEPGYDISSLVVARVSLPSDRYQDAEARSAFRSQLGEALHALPAIEGVSFNLGGIPPNPNFSFSLELETRDGGVLDAQPEYLPFANVDTAYFSVMGIPIVAGRSFRGDDLRGERDAVIIDEDLARLLWPEQNPVGQQFRLTADQSWLTVIGVSDDVKLAGPEEPFGEYALYYPGEGSTIALRTASDAAATLAAVRETIWSLDPGIPLTTLTAEVQYREALEQPRFLLTLMIIFAVIGLVLSAIGFYGVVAYDVAQRSREIGVRIALGARTARVVGDVFTAGMVLAAAGLGLGLASALVLSRFLRGVLFEIGPTDPTALLVVTFTLIATCVLALLVPSLRAARVNPLQALRVD